VEEDVTLKPLTIAIAVGLFDERLHKIVNAFTERVRQVVHKPGHK